MPLNAIVSATGAILALAPPDDPGRDLPLPEGAEGARLVALADAGLALLGTPDASFSVDEAGAIIATPVAQVVTPDPTAAADVTAFTALEQATTVDELKAVILAWMQSRPGIAT